MDGERFAKSGFDETFVCELCGLSGAGPIHKYWTCPKLCTLPDEDQCISKSQHLKEKALKDFGCYPCLWGRGILPHDLWNIDDHAPPAAIGEADWSVVGDWQGTVLASQQAWSDGAGGEQWVPKTCRRAGAGAASMHYTYDPQSGAFDLHSLAWASAPVFGRQSVPRAETQAAQMALTLGSPRRLGIDAAYVTKGAATEEDLSRRVKGENGDSWARLRDTLLSKRQPPNQTRSRRTPQRAPSRTTSVITSRTSPPRWEPVMRSRPGTSWSGSTNGKAKHTWWPAA